MARNRHSTPTFSYAQATDAAKEDSSISTEQWLKAAEIGLAMAPALLAVGTGVYKAAADEKNWTPRERQEFNRKVTSETPFR